MNLRDFSRIVPVLNLPSGAPHRQGEQINPLGQQFDKASINFTKWLNQSLGSTVYEAQTYQEIFKTMPGGRIPTTRKRVADRILTNSPMTILFLFPGANNEKTHLWGLIWDLAEQTRYDPGKIVPVYFPGAEYCGDLEDVVPVDFRVNSIAELCREWTRLVDVIKEKLGVDFAAPDAYALQTALPKP